MNDVYELLSITEKLLGRYTPKETEFMKKTKKNAKSDETTTTWFSPVLDEMSGYIDETARTFEKK